VIHWYYRKRRQGVLNQKENIMAGWRDPGNWESLVAIAAMLPVVIGFGWSAVKETLRVGLLVENEDK
jgi:hypothetical protein